MPSKRKKKLFQSYECFFLFHFSFCFVVSFVVVISNNLLALCTRTKYYVIWCCVCCRVSIIRHGHIKCLFIKLHYEFISHLCFTAFVNVFWFPPPILFFAQTRYILSLGFRPFTHRTKHNIIQTNAFCSKILIIIAGCDTIDSYRARWRPQFEIPTSNSTEVHIKLLFWRIIDSSDKLLWAGTCLGISMFKFSLSNFDRKFLSSRNGVNRLSSDLGSSA